MAPNILLSLALIRWIRPHVQNLVQRSGWPALALVASALILVLPTAGNVVEYGAEGWLWALFGLCQRMYVDSRAGTGLASTANDRAPEARNLGLMRLLACIAAAVIYIWQEQMEFSFSQVHFTALIFGIGVLSFSLCVFLRGPSRIQPPEPIASALHFIGRHTLEIYAIQLAGFELIIKFIPSLAA